MPAAALPTPQAPAAHRPPAATPATLTAAAAKTRALAVTDGLLDQMQRIEPGLSGPLYVVFGQLRKQNMAGQYFPGLAATFEADARAAGLWHGRGHGVLLDEDQYQIDFSDAAAAGLTAQQANAYATLACSGKVIHEFCHALASGFSGTEDPLGNSEFDPREVRSVVFNDSPDKLRAATAYDAALPPFQKHDAAFLRAVIHLTARMMPTTKGLMLDHVVHCEKFGLSPIGQYALGLAKELPIRAPIARLIASPAPAAFRNLWKDDVAKWYASLTNPTDLQIEAGAKALRSCP